MISLVSLIYIYIYDIDIYIVIVFLFFKLYEARELFVSYFRGGLACDFSNYTYVYKRIVHKRDGGVVRTRYLWLTLCTRRI